MNLAIPLRIESSVLQSKICRQVDNPFHVLNQSRHERLRSPVWQTTKNNIDTVEQRGFEKFELHVDISRRKTWVEIANRNPRLALPRREREVELRMVGEKPKKFRSGKARSAENAYRSHLHNLHGDA